ncbi:MAG TPA: ATP-binding protein [Spirochaetota bacterium]|nr:ATP-binding protein [Spirochaetota bacterium]HQQ23760.1 ATP-binding protein [Spirochaetota bacterium]
MCTIIIIIKQKKSERTLIEKTNILNDILLNVPHYIFWKDVSGIYRGCSKSFAEITGLDSPESIIGKTDNELPWRNDDRLAYIKMDEAVITVGKPIINIEEPLRSSDGNISTILISKIPLKTSTGKITGVLGLALDITERKNLEQQLNQSEKMDILAQLSGGIAHDFNNMLGGIMGNADMLLTQLPQNSPYKDYVNLIIDGSEKASELVGKLMAFSRKTDSAKIKTDLNDSLKDISTTLSRISKSNIAISTNFKSNTPFILADSPSLQSIFLNICVNSKEAMTEGGSISISTENVYLDETYIKTCVNKVTPGDYIEVDISDTGSGIDKNIIDKIFDPFFSTKSDFNHQGLGLSTVFGNVKNLNGTINVFSEKGKGSSFRIYFPVLKTDTSKFSAENDSLIYGNDCLLLIDDEDIIRKTAYEQLLYLGYSTLMSDEGLRGINIYRAEKHRIAAVILDLIMPNQNGIDVYKKLLEINPEVKVLFTSGFSRDASLDEYLMSKNTGFIKKPFRLAPLSKAIAKLLQK